MQTLFVSYMIHDIDQADEGDHPDVKAYFEEMYDAKYLQNTFFVCSSNVDVQILAEEMKKDIWDIMECDSDVVVIDTFAAGFAGDFDKADITPNIIQHRIAKSNSARKPKR